MKIIRSEEEDRRSKKIGRRRGRGEEEAGVRR